MRRYAYFYLMADDTVRVGSLVPAHVAYWRGLRLLGYSGGPFADRTGGLITFDAVDDEAAAAAAASDPFAKERVLASAWLKEWTPE